ncbi:2-oxoacid:acceptor oxidoreductase subunit alpha [Methanofollis fontis]|uniref:Pyruvate ferredoxin oxidoreductase n=1 Tax=Methanofollis fontis TaxID=2052832 RepID=A0A483CQA3_9EURY|nr:2-oxoacid:acceptor oxidoreductase subunit alpha [Methanofollis fontis]TAJ44865.1 pyruvate ferredoxin oxidoreductase [Methanofollis fontis]
MQDYSVLIGGRAGEGINIAGNVIARLLSACGLCVHMYYDYPSLIKGGHNFAIIRGADTQPYCVREGVDLLLALNRETLERHRHRTDDRTTVIFDAGRVRGAAGNGIPVDEIVREEEAPPITRNSAMIGAFCRACAIPWETVETVFRRAMPAQIDSNLRVARRGYDTLPEGKGIRMNGAAPLPVISGNEAIAFGLAAAGLEGYIAYPMTPSSSILHTLAAHAEGFGIPVVHPENEIAVAMMALGAAYAGRRMAVGTSGGGFCLMTEAFSLAGMAEIPLLVVLAQRPGPSTGVPTYSAQGDLLFALSAGQGEFPRPVAAPGTPEEAWDWAGCLLDAAWRFQTPAILLTDKNLAEGLYSFTPPETNTGLEIIEWEGKGEYARYAPGTDGISPLAFPGRQGISVKANSYTHDERGITTEDPASITRMAEKLQKKRYAIQESLESRPCVKVGGRRDASDAILCWGSTAGVCAEVANDLGLRLVRPVLISPFPVSGFARCLEGVEHIIAVEENITGQLAHLIGCHGFSADTVIGKYDGRPFAPEDLERRIGEVIG